MKKAEDVTQEDRDLMTQHNIEMETKTVFYSQGYKYDNLKDAVKFAKLSNEQEQNHADN